MSTWVVLVTLIIRDPKWQFKMLIKHLRKTIDWKKLFIKCISNKGFDPEYIKNSYNSITKKDYPVKTVVKRFDQIFHTKKDT